MTNNENILGHWQVINNDYPFLYGTACVGYTLEENPIRFIFHPDSLINFFPGFEKENGEFLGYTSRYFSENNQLYIFDLTNKDWEEYKIIRNSGKSMILEKDSFEIILTSYVPDTTIQQKIDQVIIDVNYSGSPCLSYSFILTKDDIKINLHDSSLFIQNGLSASLIKKFEQINLSQLNDNYKDPFYLSSHERKVNFTFINGNDTIKKIASTLPFTPYELKNILIQTDYIVSKAIQ